MEVFSTKKESSQQTEPNPDETFDSPPEPQNAEAVENLAFDNINVSTRKQKRDELPTDLTTYTASKYTVHESRRLYKFHFTRELMLNGFLVPKNFFCQEIPLYKSAFVRLSDQFKTSLQREWVHEQAQRVSLESLSSQTFQILLDGVFQEGDDILERILILFFFCTDLASRAYREKLNDSFLFLHNWMLAFISNTVSNCIDELGGWEEVLGRSNNNFLKYMLATTFCIGIIAAIIYVKKYKS